MRKRLLELGLLVVVIAAVVSLSWEKKPAPGVATTTTAVRAIASPGPPRIGGLAVEDQGAREATVEDPRLGPQQTMWKALYDEAQAFLAQGDNAKAEARLVECLKFAPQAGPDALHQTLDDLGLVCFRQADYQRAADYQERAVKAAADLKTRDGLALVGLYESRLASALASLQRRDEALAALSRARQSYQRALPAGSPALSEAMSSLAAQHRSLGDNEGAARIVGEQ